MSNDQRQNQNQQTQVPARAADPRFEPIKVKKLELQHGFVISGIKSVENRNVVAGQHPRMSYLHTEIWFEPWQRMYRVRETNKTPTPSGKPTIEERCIPETWASYEPAVIG